MEQTVEVARSFHVRMSSIISLLLIADLLLVRHCLQAVLARSSNVMIVFAFEFSILAYTIAAVAGKYVLNLIEARQTETWDNKSVYVFYLELSTDFVKLVTYFAFFTTLMTFYGFPLHIIRDLYVTLRSFTTKCRNFMRFRKATQDMDSRYPNATIEELDATGDKTCIVCREDMLHGSQPVPEGEPAHTALDNPKRLPCGHILHFRCLRSWLERQQSCPMCRRPVIDDTTTPEHTRDAAPRPRPDAPQNHPPPGDAAAQQQPQAAPPNTNDTPGGGSQPSRFQMHREQGSGPIQLPRGFRLPPGWALLPVSTVADSPSDRTAESPTLDTPTSTLPSSTAPSTTESTTNAPRDPAPARIPPIIPLFNMGSNHVPRGTTATTLPPTLSEEQIAAMETSTRRTVEERLRLLGELQSRVTEAFTMLTRLQSIPIPPEAQSPAVPETSTPTTTTTDTSNDTMPAATMVEEEQEELATPLFPTTQVEETSPLLDSRDASDH